MIDVPECLHIEKLRSNLLTIQYYHLQSIAGEILSKMCNNCGDCPASFLSKLDKPNEPNRTAVRDISIIES